MRENRSLEPLGVSMKRIVQSRFEPVVVLMVDDDKEDIYATKRAFAEGKIANDFRSRLLF